MNLPLNVAVVGCGMLARQQRIPNIIRSERMTLHTCCDLDDTALAACQQLAPDINTSADFHQTVKDPAIDLVVLTTTEAVRLPVIEACAQAGKPMYVEKPLAGTLQELRQIEDFVGAARINVCVGHNRRSSPAMLEVTALEGGMLNHGVVIGYEAGGIATITMGGNGTFGYPKELYEVCGHGAVVAVDHMLEIRTAGIESAPARITYPMLGDRHPQLGTEGGLFGWLEKKRQACAEAAAAGDNSLIFTAEPDKGHAAALERFVDEIMGEGPVVCGVADAALATRVAFAAIRSAQEHRPVKVSEI